MQKYFSILGVLALLGAVVFMSQLSTNTAYAASGKKLFKKHGCQACHYKKTGRVKKPFPSLPEMATISFKDFYDCVHNGRKGTAMTPKANIGKSHVKAIYKYIKTFKGK